VLLVGGFVGRQVLWASGLPCLLAGGGAGQWVVCLVAASVGGQHQPQRGGRVSCWLSSWHHCWCSHQCICRPSCRRQLNHRLSSRRSWHLAMLTHLRSQCNPHQRWAGTCSAACLLLPVPANTSAGSHASAVPAGSLNGFRQGCLPAGRHGGWQTHLCGTCYLSGLTHSCVNEKIFVCVCNLGGAVGQSGQTWHSLSCVGLTADIPKHAAASLAVARVLISPVFGVSLTTGCASVCVCVLQWLRLRYKGRQWSLAEVGVWGLPEQHGLAAGRPGHCFGVQWWQPALALLGRPWELRQAPKQCGT
jgi:hypothetical protein